MISIYPAGSDTSSNYVLRLYGPAALTASIGSSRVTRGSILFLNQCYSNIAFKNKNELTIKNREQEMGCLKTEEAALLQSRYNATSLPRPPSLSVPPSVLSPLPLPQLNVNLLNMKKEVYLKLRPSTGSIHLLIANGTDCVGTGMCRGAYPNLYRQADILSVWCEQNSSLFLSRYVLTVQYGVL